MEPLHNGGRDYMPHTDPRAQVDPEAAWTKVDIAFILILIIAPIIGLAFGF